MDNWFNSKWFVRGVSLAFAILLYVFVGIEVSKTQTDSTFVPTGSDEQILNDVPVNIQIDRERFVVSGVPEFVTTSLEGPKGILTTVVMQRNFEVYVDLEGLGEGTHLVDLEYEKMPSDISVYIEPKTIEVEIEERASEEFDVSVDFINKDKLPVGYELGEVEINPEKVTLTSSKSVIDQVAIVKMYLDLEGLTEPIKSREIPVNVYDNQGNMLNVRKEPESIVVSVDVDNPSKLVSVDIATSGEAPEGYEVTSITSEVEEIEVFATSDILAELEELTTEEIDLSELTESGEIEAKIDLPEGAQVKEEDIIVKVEVEQTKEIEEVPISVKGGEGKEFSFQSPNKAMMEVTVAGKPDEISELKLEDITLSIDISGLSEGTHDVPVLIEGPKGIKITGEYEEISIVII